MSLNAVLRRSAFALALVGLAAVGGCSSSGSAPQTGGGNSTSGSSSTASTPSGPPVADKVTTAGIRHAYETFFNYRTSKTVAQSLLQDGAAFKAEIAQNARTAAVQKPTVKLNSVELVSAHGAKVIFTLSINGTPTLVKTSGFAVLEGDTWKVAGQTFCALIGLNGSHPPVCQSAAATTIP